MQGDFSRDSFEPLRGFSRVLSQQGRLTLDADWNELQSIQLHLLRTLAKDLIGADAGSGFDIVGTTDRDFTVSPGHYYVDGWLCENDRPVLYQQRRPAVGGTGETRELQPHLAIAVDKDALGVQVTTQYVVYLDVWERHLSFAETDGLIEVDHRFPPLLRDEALGRVDTASRAQVVWQARIDKIEPVDATLVIAPAELTLEVGESHPPIAAVIGGPVPPPALKWSSSNPPVATFAGDGTISAVVAGTTTITATFGTGPGAKSETARLTVVLKGADVGRGDALSAADRTNLLEVIHWNDRLGGLQPTARGSLKAEARQAADTATDPCIVSPTAQYRGVENHLYRVEIHRGGAEGDATFKWSRENASVVFPIQSIQGTTIKLRDWWSASRLGLALDDLVEVLDDDATLRHDAFTLCRVKEVDPDSKTVTLDRVPSVGGGDPAKHPIVRRWDHRGVTTPRGSDLGRLADDGALLIEEDDETWIGLEDGVRVQFTPSGGPDAHMYRTGDYWLIPARVNIADVVWRRDDAGPVALPPRGVEHHYAPLAIIQVDGAGAVTRLFSLRRPVAGA